MASQIPLKSPKMTRSWRLGGKPRVSILGRVADMSLNALSWRRRSRTVVCTQVDRVLTSHMGSHGRRLMAFGSSDILEDEAGKNLGGCSLEGR